MEEESERRIYIARLICGKIITPIICLTGIVANSINMIVLTRSWMRSSTNVYLTAVAASDLIYLTHSLLFSLQVYAGARRCGLYMYTVPIIHGTANLFSNMTTWLTVSFTIERFINISFPIFGHRFCTRRKARVAVIVVCVASFIFTFPDYLQNKVVPQTYANGSLVPNGMYLVTGSKYQKFLTAFGYAFINQTAFVILPLLLLTVFNILLIFRVLSAHRQRCGMSKSPDDPNRKYTSSIRSLAPRSPPCPSDAQDITGTFPQRTWNTVITTTVAVAKIKPRRSGFGEQQRITVMLIAIVVTFLLLQMPSTVLNILSNLLDMDSRRRDLHFASTLIIFSNISNVLLFFNATMNFVFYSLFSLKFRTTCKALFHGSKCGAELNAFDTKMNSTFKRSASATHNAGGIITRIPPVDRSPPENCLT
ncbi:unnamed protein product [Schistocephalus solidus]|uniref:FMRFamide receptor n=1 Tax=Schistocephalus solidus TaxID=70667 RepID=A0A0X3PSF8_SCHSO|nr:unnamed protein product [Schistocephalus solidus]